MRHFLALTLMSSPLLAAGEANYDESRIPAFTLPAPLVAADGGKITDPADWPARRAEILALFEKNVYGRIPEKARDARLVARPGRTIDDFLDGKATAREIALALGDGPDAPAIHLLLITPKAATSPAPVFLVPNFGGNHTLHPDPRITLATPAAAPGQEARPSPRGSAASRWPLELIIDRGYALATFHYGDVDPDFDDGFANGFHAVFGKPQADEWGSIATWAWGLSRTLDHLEDDPAIDAERVALMGHSRLGKTALWAGACDPRFALVVSNNSGCGGAALSRRAIGETVERINTSFPHWFCDNFQQYNSRESALPVDQHMLLALIAPRPLYVASAVDDRWADPKGEFLSALHAEPVYRLLGKEGLGSDRQPAIDHPVGGSIRYHVRSGGHDVTTYDWRQYLDFADRQLVK